VDRIGIGIRVKSGWAVAVVLEGPAARPTVVDRQELRLADPDVPDSAQPYHAALGLPQKEAAKRIAHLVKVVHRVTTRSVEGLLKPYRRADSDVLGIGIVVGSDVDPATIKNDHIRAHAEEGRLFRIAVEEAAARCGLKPSVTVEKYIFQTASAALSRPEGQCRAEVAALGKQVGGRWRSEEKAAALAAWILLREDNRSQR
jgi:hypothetical protein